jgi:hypothetical protein
MSTRKKWELDRRTFLQGLGVSVGLPFLEAMLPSVARAANGRTQKLVWIYMPLGHASRSYVNNGLYTYPDGMKSILTPIQSDVSRVTNLLGAQLGNSGDAHIANFIPYVNNGIYAPNIASMGKTFDQYIADLNVGSKLKTISMTAEYGSHGGLISDIQTNTLSYAGPDRPVSVAADPKSLFDQLFTGATSTQVDQRMQDQLNRKRGILHYVTGEISKISSSVGKDDKVRLDEYFTGINELDKKISTLSTPTPMACEKPTLSNSADYPTRLRLFYDIIFYALKCDLTRVATVMHGKEGSGLQHNSFIPGLHSQSGWHGMSHLTPNYQGSTGDENLNYADFLKVMQWHQQQIVDFVTKLKNTNLPNGQRLLDECAVMWGSSMSNSETHHQYGLAMNIAGTANGALKKAVNIDVGNQAPVANFYLTMMQAFGSTATQIGVSNGTISGLRA